MRALRSQPLRRRQIARASLLAILLAAWTAGGSDRDVRTTTVDAVDRHSWGPNVGWLDWHADSANGAEFGPLVAAGFVWSANCGWINLGDGTPTNGTSYGNASAADCGVNVDAVSDPSFFLLSGFAWSANVGWINFDVVAQTGPADRPRIEKTTGILRGFAWSANVGWLPLDSTVAVVRTGLIVAPPFHGLVAR